MLTVAISILAAVGCFVAGIFIGHRLGYFDALEDMRAQAEATWRQVERGGA